MDNNSKYLGIILAAGKGNRLDFSGPKPLFNVFGRPMIDYLINSFLKIGMIDLLTVVGHQKERVINHINKDPSGNIWIINPYSEVYNLPVAIQLADGDS